MANQLYQTQIRPRQHFLPAEMNIVSIKSQNNALNERIDKIHKKMFSEQINEVVVGYLYSIEPNNLLNEIPYLLQQMEYKQIHDQERRQILVILHYESGKNQESEPVTLIRNAINCYQKDVIDLNRDKTYEISTQMDFENVKKFYKNEVQVEADPFKIKDRINDEELNKLYYICLRECEARLISCILLQINKVNERIFNDSKLANRIFQILKRWQNLQQKEQKGMDGKDGNQSIK